MLLFPAFSEGCPFCRKAKVYVAGKSYGVEVTIPMNIRDDIVWRGQLSTRWFEEGKGRTWPFGDVELTFEVVEYF